MASVSYKACARCKTHLPASEFYSNKRASSGLSSWCKPCARRIKAESNARIRAADPGAWRLRRQRYVGAYRERHPERLAAAERSRLLRRKYGITDDEYAAMLAAQGGVCAICQAPPVGRPLSVDHHHATGRNRELLCAPCNFAVGHLRERPDLAMAVAAYLTKWSV